VALPVCWNASRLALERIARQGAEGPCVYLAWASAGADGVRCARADCQTAGVGSNRGITGSPSAIVHPFPLRSVWNRGKTRHCPFARMASAGFWYTAGGGTAWGPSGHPLGDPCRKLRRSRPCVDEVSIGWPRLITTSSRLKGPLGRTQSEQ